MFDMSLGAGELIIRAVAVYFFLFVLMRFIGKKHVGDLAPFDLVVLLILSETVSNSLHGGDESLIGGLISAATLILLVLGISFISSRSKTAERFLEGVPRVLVRHGTRRKDVMAREHITESELVEALRRNGCTSILNVRAAVLENDGKISIITREPRG